MTPRGVVQVFTVAAILGLIAGGVWSVAPPASAGVDAPAAAGDVALTSALATAWADKAIGASRAAISVVDCADGRVLYASGADVPLNPASNLKLFTAAVALESLGPAFRFKTRILADAAPEAGVIKGNLYLKGGGDPELVYEKVWKMVKDLQALGLERIEGDLVADGTYFDDERAIPGWADDGEDASRAYNAVLGALSFNFNTIALMVRPGATVGAPAVVSLETPTSYVRFDVQATTAAAGRGKGLSVQAADASGTLMKVTGTVSVDAGPRRFYRSVPDPERFALTLLGEMLEKEGITVTGTRRVGVAPTAGVVLHEAESQSLDIVLKYMNKLSSNFIAEQVLKSLAAEARGAPGSTAQGLEVIRERLRARGLSTEALVLRNGSGLSRETRVRAQDFTDLLVSVYRDPVIRWEFVSSLPIAGVDGTLRKRMRNGPAQGLVRAKTGSIDGVYGMSGYAVLPDGRMAAFSMMANDVKGSTAGVRRAMDAVLQVLITPSAAPVGP